MNFLCCRALMDKLNTITERNVEKPAKRPEFLPFTNVQELENFEKATEDDFEDLVTQGKILNSILFYCKPLSNAIFIFRSSILFGCGRKL